MARGPCCAIGSGKALPLRLWVGFVDCKSESESNYPALVATAGHLGIQFHRSPVPWAAYFGTTERPGKATPVEPDSIPVRPRMPKKELLALVAALGFDLGTESVRVPTSANETPVSMVCNSANGVQEAADGETSSFLEEVYRLAESNHRLAAARIMEYIDGLLHTCAFEECKRVIDRVDVLRLLKHPTLVLAFLGITLGAKAILADSRSRFYSSAKAALTDEFGASRAERILHRFQ